MRQPSGPDGFIASAMPAPIAKTAVKRPATALSPALLTTTEPYTSPVSGVDLPPMAVFRAATKVSAMVDKVGASLALALALAVIPTCLSAAMVSS